MLSLIRLRYFPIIGLRAVRYASSKKKPPTSSTLVHRHNWLDTSSEIFPPDASNLPALPDSSFNTRLIQYLSNSVKTTLTDDVQQHLLSNFQSWAPQEFYDLVSILGSYGLQPVDALRLLINLPSADKTIVSVEAFKRCFENLLQLKLDTTTRAVLVSNDPHVIQYDLSYLRERADVLMCYFTTREIHKLVRTHPKLFSEKWSDLDYKINYLKIMLFASTRDIVESGALAYSIEHIRQRYLFVYRAGLFKRVRRKEQYVQQRELNIGLIDIFSTSLSTFLKRTTSNLLRPDDYQAFVDSLKYEVFDNEFERYLTRDKERKKWSQAQMYAERLERRHWMGELDMYNNLDEEDDTDEHSLAIISEKSVALNSEESKPSALHPLSDYDPDRHRRRKLRHNIEKNTYLMAAQVARLPTLLVGRVLTKNNTTTAIVRVLQMKLDDKFDMFFNQRIDYKAFDKREQTKVGDIVLLKKRPTLECRYPLERYEISEIVYELGRIKDPLTGRRCNGLRFLDESSVAVDRENQLKRLSVPPLPTKASE